MTKDHMVALTESSVFGNYFIHNIAWKSLDKYETWFEKSAEYYNSLSAPSRILAMNSTVKIISVGRIDYSSPP